MARRVMLGGEPSLPVVSHLAWSIISTAWALDATWDGIYARSNLRVAAWQDKSRADATLGIDGTEDIS